jgi:tRNA(fMet)-specific endonuclease VapC
MVMKNIALDTCAYSSFKYGNSDIINIIQNVDTINISYVVVGELLAGFAIGNKEKQNKNELNEFLQSNRCQHIAVDNNTAIYYAHIYKKLRQKGKAIPVNDLWIAALAMQHGHILCTFDSHFNYIDDLLICSQLNHILP